MNSSADGSDVPVPKKIGTRTSKQYEFWGTGKESELIKLFNEGVSLEALAERYKRSPAAIRKKLKRLGLNVVATKLDMTGQLKMPKDLPSLEEVLKIVAGAIYKACQGGLGKTELQRLQTIATLYKAYAEGLEQFVGYRKIEAKMIEMEAKWEEREQAEKAKGGKA